MSVFVNGRGGGAKRQREGGVGKERQRVRHCIVAMHTGRHEKCTVLNNKSV